MPASPSREVPGRTPDPGLLGSLELPRARAAAAGLPGRAPAVPSPAAGTAPRGGHAPTLHPSGCSEKAGGGLHGPHAWSFGTAKPSPSLLPFPSAKFSQNVPKAALQLAKSKRDGLGKHLQNLLFFQKFSRFFSKVSQK